MVCIDIYRVGDGKQKNKEKILIEAGTETNILPKADCFNNEVEAVLALHVDLATFTNLKLF